MPLILILLVDSDSSEWRWEIPCCINSYIINSEFDDYMCNLIFDCENVTQIGNQKENARKVAKGQSHRFSSEQLLGCLWTVLGNTCTS